MAACYERGTPACQKKKSEVRRDVRALVRDGVVLVFPTCRKVWWIATDGPRIWYLNNFEKNSFLGSYELIFWYPRTAPPESPRFFKK